MASQAKLSAEQIEAFYHEEFVDDQVNDYQAMFSKNGEQNIVVDVGGGCGFFARKLADVAGERTRVIDMDPKSVEICERLGVEAQVGDALAPHPMGDEDVVAFNLILHHLVGKTEADTRHLQIKTLKAWHGKVKYIFINEYIYQSLMFNLSGRLIFEITSSKFLSLIGRNVAKVFPALKANTFGVGVRFRSHDEWRKLFAEAGYRVVDSRIGQPERVYPLLRGLLIRDIRRDSFVIMPN